MTSVYAGVTNNPHWPFPSAACNIAMTKDPELAKHDKEDVVAPSLSILAEPPVAVVDKVVDKHGTRKLDDAYLQYLYTDEGQEIIAKHYCRPTVEKEAKKYAAQFPKLKLFTIDELFGGWTKVQKTHFADGGIFDQIYQPGKK